uniref:Uncharacterized protein n=1 Tax=Anguilla anguilla TaxID=7936 RepID=A0A0E9WSM1_ANGAN
MKNQYAMSTAEHIHVLISSGLYTSNSHKEDFTGPALEPFLIQTECSCGFC